MVGYGLGDRVEEQGGAAGRMKRHTKLEPFFCFSVLVGCRLTRFAFSIVISRQYCSALYFQKAGELITSRSPGDRKKQMFFKYRYVLC